MSARVERLQGQLPELGLAAFLVTSLVNVRYLTGFVSSNAALLVQPELVRLFTDGRYADAAHDVNGVELLQVERNLMADVAGRLDDLVFGPVGFEADTVTFSQHAKLSAAAAELRPLTDLVERIRAVKEPDELAAIREAARILDEAIASLAEQRVVGRSEAELAWWLQSRIRELGAEDVSFDPIVAAGPNAALPHHHPGPRVVEPNETLLIDAGARVGGYCSDCTRTFATGSLPAELTRAYEVCLQAQTASLQAVRAGAGGAELDAIARTMIRDEGYLVMHGLGHAVGLEIHESPRLSDTSTATLETGNVVTVEPGVYLPGLGGVRIEDLVVVTDGAPEVLTPFTKELVTLN
jgi:Xaa-Pro aminopeptidase